MKRINAIGTIFAVIGILISMQTFGQETGDYRSAATGNWSEIATWEVYNGTEWEAASEPPEGTENIFIVGDDTVTVDGSVNVSGYIKVEENAYLTIDGDTGSLDFEDGSTYEHARDAGSVPVAVWGEGSTFLLTGTVQDAPGNRNQDFYNVILNTPDLGRNRDMGWNGVTIGGDVHVLSTGGNRWQMSSVSAADTAVFSIMGDVIVENGQFAVQGTGNALTIFEVHHFGNILVTGGNFSAARGSQGNGSGSTIWYLYEGDFIMSDATTQNSNSGDQGGVTKYVFAKADSQSISFTNVSFAGGAFNFDVSDSTVLLIEEDLSVNGTIVNEGNITPVGELTIANGGVYEHAQNGGSIPSAAWANGSTALFTGITTDAPGNRGQDYYNLILNTPDLLSNRDLSLDGNTISGNIHVISTGSARWQMVGGSSGTVTIMGDVIMEDGQFASQGTGSATEVIIDHYGDIIVTGGNFAVGRGSQGGTGTTRWYLHEGDFSLTDATTQNSNPAGATFVLAKDGVQLLSLTNVTYAGGGLPVEISSGATVDMGEYAIEGNGAFVINDGGVLATAHPDGIDGNLLTSGDIIFDAGAGFMYNGTQAQVPGLLLPDSTGSVIIANAEGVAFNDTLWSNNLHVAPEGLMLLDTLANVSVNAGTVDGTIVVIGAISADEFLIFEDGSVYEHARNGGSVPNGQWNEGSTFLVTGTEGNAPGNRNQAYYNIVLNTPNMVSNVDLSLNNVTIGGDLTVLSSGSARWRLTSVSAGDTAIVTIMGDVFVQDASFETQGTGNALTVFEVHHYGNIEANGGNFSVARGSQGSGSGSTRWYLYEGDLSISDATTQNSNPTNAWFVFTKDGVQNISLSSVNFGGGGLALEVVSGTTLDFGTSELGGNGLFVLNENATLTTAHEDGIAGTIQTTGDVTFDEGANYAFNGTDAQVTSGLMPVTVNNLTIDNQAGVALSQETTINGILLLANGEFDNTIPFILGPDADIVYENGTLKSPVSVEKLSGLPTEFAMLQNYPNPFNPSTTIRFDVPEQTFVTLKIYDITGREVVELVSDEFNPGIYTVEWNAQGVASGVYYYRITAGEFTQVRSLIFMK